MALSRKHFREIARILGENLADDDLINEFVSFCASQNQYFQKQVFIDACGFIILNNGDFKRLD